MLRRIRVNSFVRAAVYGQICLAVAIEIQAPEHHRTLHGLLENPCEELPALREDDARARDTDGENFHGVSGCSLSGIHLTNAGSLSKTAASGARAPLDAVITAGMNPRPSNSGIC